MTEHRYFTCDRVGCYKRVEYLPKLRATIQAGPGAQIDAEIIFSWDKSNNKPHLCEEHAREAARILLQKITGAD